MSGEHVKGQSNMINKANAIRCFLEHIEQLSRLPLITDLEMNKLFGEEVAAALTELHRYNLEEQVCLHCENRCCQAANCEFYAPQFSQCPIYDFRPVICRLHFCHRFHIDSNSLLQEISDIFFDCVLAADRYGSSQAQLFDCPPLAGSSPGLVAVAAPWVNAARAGSLNPEHAARLIRQSAEKYRTADN